MYIFNIIILCLLIFTSCTKPGEDYYYEFGANHDIERLTKWKSEQLAQASNISVFHDFTFKDFFYNSHITFKHQVVLDLQKDYIANHYDHGNGLAIADVNNDQLYDIFFVNQLGGNELWINKGKGIFEISQFNSTIALKSSISVSAAFGDFNNDGLSDLAISTVRDGVYLFQNTSNGQFKNVSNLIKPNYNRHSSGLFFLDYNLDGKLDLFVTNTGVYTTDNKRSDGICYPGIKDSFDGHLFPERTEPSVLYENQGELGFQDVSLKHKLFEPNWNGDGTFIAFGKDLHPKIYLTNMQGQDSFWVMNKDSNYTNEIISYFPKSSWGTMGVAFFDYNNDGFFDLYTTDMHSDMFPPYPKNMDEQKITLNNPFTANMELQKIIVDKNKTTFGNLFYENNGKNIFTEKAPEKNLENFWPWGISAEDINSDGYTDIFITSGMNYTTDYGINWVYLNDKAKKFANAEFILGVEPRNELLTQWFDLDCKNKDRNHQLCSKYNGKLHVMAPRGSRSSAIFDIDNDGDLDIVTNEFNSNPQILISSLSNHKKINFMKIILLGVKSNKQGLGSRIDISSSGLNQSRYVNGKSGYLSQSSLPTYFGLPSNGKIDSIKITWPSGVIDILDKNILINSTIKIEEGKGIIN